MRPLGIALRRRVPRCTARRSRRRGASARRLLGRRRSRQWPRTGRPRLWRLPNGRDDLVEISCHRWRRARHAGILVHESTLPRRQLIVTVVDGVPSTSIERTIVDSCARREAQSWPDSTIDAALRRQLTDWHGSPSAAPPRDAGAGAASRSIGQVLEARPDSAALPGSEPERLVGDGARASGIAASRVTQYVVRGTDRRVRRSSRPRVSGRARRSSTTATRSTRARSRSIRDSARRNAIGRARLHRAHRDAVDLPGSSAGRGISRTSTPRRRVERRTRELASLRTRTTRSSDASSGTTRRRRTPSGRPCSAMRLGDDLGLLAERRRPCASRTSTAPISTTRQTPAIAKRTSSLRRLMIAGSIEQRHQVHHLDERVERGAGGVLERVTDGVTDDRRLVGLGALAALVAVLDVLLGVVPRATGVAQEVGHELAGEDHAGEERAEGVDS